MMSPRSSHLSASDATPPALLPQVPFEEIGPNQGCVEEYWRREALRRLTELRDRIGDGEIHLPDSEVTSIGLNSPCVCPLERIRDWVSFSSAAQRQKEQMLSERKILRVVLCGGAATGVRSDPSTVLPGGKALVSSGLTYQGRGLPFIELPFLGTELPLCFASSAQTMPAIRDYLATSEVAQAHCNYEVLADYLSPSKMAIDGTIQANRDPLNPENYSPAGHGTFLVEWYHAGILQQWLRSGIQYLTTSNIDNPVGMVPLDVAVFAAVHKIPYVLIGVQRENRDLKGGHLCLRQFDGPRDGTSFSQVSTRESCEKPEGESNFDNIEEHPLFFTNSALIDLAAFVRMLDSYEGLPPVPVLANRKGDVYQPEIALAHLLALTPPLEATPTDAKLGGSPGLSQLISWLQGRPQLEFPSLDLPTAETNIPGTSQVRCVVVPREENFCPWKTTSGLFSYHSGALTINESGEVRVCTKSGKKPDVDLDPTHYKDLNRYLSLLPPGSCNAEACESFKVVGPLSTAHLAPHTGNAPLAIVGRVEIIVIPPAEDAKAISRVALPAAITTLENVQLTIHPGSTCTMTPLAPDEKPSADTQETALAHVPW